MRASEVISRCAPEGVVARFADDDAGEGVLEDARGARLRIAARVATTAETRRRCEIARALGVEIANASGDVNAFCDAVRSALERAFAAMSARRGASASALVGDRIGRGKKSTRGRRHAATGRRGTTAE